MLLQEKLSYVLLVSTCKQPNELLNSPTAAAVPLLVFLINSEARWVVLEGSSWQTLLVLLHVCVSSCMTICIYFKLAHSCFGTNNKIEAALTFACQTNEGFYLQVRT